MKINLEGERGMMDTVTKFIKKIFKTAYLLTPFLNYTPLPPLISSK